MSPPLITIVDRGIVLYRPSVVRLLTPHNRHHIFFVMKLMNATYYTHDGDFLENMFSHVQE